ncbi:uncharacterized protein LOC100372608 [Saccoglossus kowalevskii]|uniref:Uncharacterized protein LOC100372608 n=1 Tax=Saccoglossus kowalevskii TaxID=10224 RepID=A0ABM0GME5_SACKO|nr:PREDICTED: uncharacterized protein LOC100372608 [Saccoglossus kowalevskii]
MASSHVIECPESYDSEFADVFENLEHISDDDWASEDGDDSDFDLGEPSSNNTKAKKVGRRDLKHLDEYIGVTTTSTSDDIVRKMFTCHVCCKTFKTKRGCKLHLTNVHKVNDTCGDIKIAGRYAEQGITKQRKTKGRIHIPTYTLYHVMVDGKQLFIQAMSKLQTSDILNSRILLGVAKTKTAVTALIDGVADVEEGIISFIKVLWPAVTGGDGKLLYTSRREAIYSSYHSVRLSPELKQTVTLLLNKVNAPVSAAIIMSISRVFFDEILLARERKELNDDNNQATKMTNIEENALRYACGYIPMALSKQLQRRGPAFGSMVKTLSATKTTGTESKTFLSYTTEWVEKENRGGLFPINDTAYLFFRRVEHFIRLHFTQRHNRKIHDSVTESMLADRVALTYWSQLSAGLNDSASLQLMCMCIKLLVNIRGHSTARKIIEEFKLKAANLSRDSKGIRKELK